MAYRITDTLAALEASRETPLDPTLARGLRDSRDVISGILSGTGVTWRAIQVLKMSNSFYNQEMVKSLVNRQF